MKQSKISVSSKKKTEVKMPPNKIKKTLARDVKGKFVKKNIKSKKAEENKIVMPVPLVNSPGFVIKTRSQREKDNSTSNSDFREDANVKELTKPMAPKKKKGKTSQTSKKKGSDKSSNKRSPRNTRSKSKNVKSKSKDKKVKKSVDKTNKKQNKKEKKKTPKKKVSVKKEVNVERAKKNPAFCNAKSHLQK